jgi:hypothetical protein
MKTSSVWLVLVVLIGGLFGGAVHAQSLEVIELQHRTAEEVMPILRQLLEPGGALTGQDYKLFVRASSANVKQLRSALAELDKQPRQLLVSVRQSTRQEVERERASVGATIRTDDGAIAVNQPPRGNSGVTVHATNSATQREGGGIASVRVSEGNSAHIANGTSIPVVTAVAAGGGRRPWAAGSVDYRNLASGFLVTPRLNRDGVVLDIAQQAQRVNNGSIETQQLKTQAAGKLGEWIQLGGIEESSSSQQSGVLSRRQSTLSDARSVWVKVEAVTE